MGNIYTKHSIEGEGEEGDRGSLQHLVELGADRGGGGIEEGAGSLREVRRLAGGGGAGEERGEGRIAGGSSNIFSKPCVLQSWKYGHFLSAHTFTF